MSAPVHRMRKDDIVRAGKWRCRHNHSGLEHWSCYIDAGMEKEKIGFFDIETTNLKADYGIILCYCIKPNDSDKIIHRTITKEELQKEACIDRAVVEQLIIDIRKFDRLVTHYGTRFDIPYSRSRAEFWSLPFPEYGEIFHTDTYYMARRALCISRNRLANVTEHLVGATLKTRIDPHHWIMALQGNAKALAYILDHCKRDVLDLERIYNKLLKYTTGASKRSL